MIKLLKSWFKGLFSHRTQAQGLYNQPTYAQVERLIAAAGGASAQGGSLYSKPTYSQFERLITALSGGSGLAGKRDKDDLAVYAYPVKYGYWTVGEGDAEKKYLPVSVFPDGDVYEWRISSTDFIRYNKTSGSLYRKVGNGAETVLVSTGLTPDDDKTPFLDTVVLLGATLKYHPTVVGSELAPTGDTLATGGTVDEAFSRAVTGASYSGSYAQLDNKPAILLKHGNTVLAAIDASAFIVDGMVDNVKIGTEGDEAGNLVVTFNAAANKQVIKIPLADIFNPEDYLTRDAINASLADKADKAAVTEALAGKADNATVDALTARIVALEGQLGGSST